MITHLLLSLCLFGVVYGITTEVTIGGLGDVLGGEESTEWSNRTVYSFRGIRYAEPPVDNLRFRPPVKITSWNGTLNATKFGPACPQTSGAYSEDCLTLNVFVPKTKKSDEEKLLPVMIFIHGGTFRYGGAHMYSPLRFLDEDLIVVVPQFRLGFLGLFSLQTDDVPGNVQFLDQIMAMQWVQDNIRYFGGDKDRVTLYGHSSGAASVHFHLLSPLTEGLFHRTILQSGSAFRTYGIDNNPIESATILADYCGCENTTNSEAIATYMRAIPVEDLLDCTAEYLNRTIYDGLTRSRGHMAVIQTAGDQKFLTDDPRNLVAEKNFLQLPMMGGVTKNDGAIYLRGIYDNVLVPRGLVDDADYARYNLTAYVLKYLGVPDITSFVEHTANKVYFANDELGDLIAMAPGLIDICSTVSYKSGSYETLHANSMQQDTYVYTFDYNTYDPDAENPRYPFDVGVDHGEDANLLFPRKDYQKYHDIDITKLLVKLWTSFVIDGVPSADGVTWPAMSTDVGPYLVIDSTTSVRENFLDEFVTSRVTSSSAITSFLINIWQYLFLIPCLAAGNNYLR